MRLDNASNIFLAAMTQVDTKVFRISAEMLESVNEQLLQRALDDTYRRWVLYHSVLRRGVFWYYLEESNLVPTVQADVMPPCAALYHFDRRELLFRVIHHRNRISLEVFHALSDGTGAQWFFTDLLTRYLRLRRAGAGPEGQERAPEVESGISHGLDPDSFVRYFGQRGSVPAVDTTFVEAAAPVTTRVRPDQQTSGGPPAARPRGLTERTEAGNKVLRIRGAQCLDYRPRVVELSMPVDQVLQLAHQHGVSLTLFLIAQFVRAAREAHPDPGRRTVTISVPVNLRLRYPSTSARNFFATTRLEYTFDQGPDDLQTICSTLDAQLKAQNTAESLEARLNKLIGFERNPAIRIIPRPVKDLILGTVYWFRNRNVTLSMSSLGRIELPADVDELVGPMGLQIATPRPQFCSISHAGVLRVTFNSPLISTAIQERFVRAMVALGVPVSAAVNKVTPAELAGE